MAAVLRFAVATSDVIPFEAAGIDLIDPWLNSKSFLDRQFPIEMLLVCSVKGSISMDWARSIQRNSEALSCNLTILTILTILGVLGAFVATFLGQFFGYYEASESAGFIGAIVILFANGKLAKPAA